MIDMEVFTLVCGAQFLLVGRRPAGLISDENELVVVIPAVLLGVHSGLQLLGGGPTGRSRAAASGQLEALLLQHVEGLLNEGMLEEES